MSETTDRAGGENTEAARAAQTHELARVAHGDLAVVTPEALERYFAVERRRNFRALCWISSAFLLVILTVCSLLLSLGSLVMRTSRKAEEYASQTAQKADQALKSYDRKIQDTVSGLQSVDEKAQTLSKSVVEDRQKYSKERDVLRQDLVRFSEWYGVKQSRVNNAVAGIGKLEEKLAELERNEAARKARLEDLERWYREARGTSPEAAAATIPPRAPAETAGLRTPTETVPSATGETAVAVSQTKAVAVATQTIAYEDGGKYEGEVKDGMKHGRGEQVFPNGDRYVGSFQNDMRHGTGVYYYGSGARYEGQFAGGKREGRGKYFYPNGDVFEGLFSNGLMNGAGAYTYANGTRIEGAWRDDIFVGSP